MRTRVLLQQDDGGTKELDIVARPSDKRTLLIEVKNRQDKSTQKDVINFLEKVALYQAQHPAEKILTGFLSLYGFTQPALDVCQEHGTGWTTELQYF